MKRLGFLVLALLFSTSAWAYNAIINCDSTNLDVVYSASSPSLQAHLTGLYLRSTPTLMISAPSGSRICANTTTASTTVPPTASNGKEYCIPAGAIGFFDVVTLGRGPSNVYLRGDSAASCTTGIIDVAIW